MNAKRFLNAAGVRAIEDAIGNHQDNLYRYEMADKACPEQTTGNGVPYSEVIRDIKERIAELKANFQEETP